MRYTLSLTFFILFSVCMCAAQTGTVRVYGPGGPYPAMKEIAENFEKEFNIPVSVTKGPLKNWQEKAKKDGDIFYSGSENMMANFLSVFGDAIVPETVYPLFYCGSGLIVRKGNPKKIKSLADLQRSDIKILVVNGAGLTGVWEDILGNMKDMAAFRKIRANIVHHAENSGLAEAYWKQNPETDVWISWNIWQIANADTADFVRLKEKYTIYRDCGIALSKAGFDNANARKFYDYIKSPHAASVFRKHGWK